MTGRAEVQRLKQRLDATFKRLGGVGSDLELQSDFARYLCILVSGYLEKATSEMVVEHARKTGGLSLQRFVNQRTRRFTNANSRKLCDLLGDFDSDWKLNYEAEIGGDLKDAVNSVVDLRNQISHGGSVSLTYATVADYYRRVQKVIDYISDLCDPQN